MGGVMDILSRAIAAYENEEYARSIDLFERAAQIYGADVVEYQMHLCRKALAAEQAEAGRSDEGDSQAIDVNLLDPATTYMLSRMGKLRLSEAEERQCLERYVTNTRDVSADADAKPVKPIPDGWPAYVVLAPLPQSTNDFAWSAARSAHVSSKPASGGRCGLSIVIPTFNRSGLLDVTLACLAAQETCHPFEVIVSDDGSSEDILGIVRRYETLLDVRYVRQKDYGYQLCAVRNLGLRAGRYDYVAILDCDMAPNSRWVEAYMQLLMADESVALIGPRKYVDTSGIDPLRFRQDVGLIESLPEVRTNNAEAGRDQGGITVDWRLDHFRRTEDLRLCDAPFRFFSGGNVAFARRWLDVAGWFDEEFTHWGGEDNEFAYRLYRHGCFFRVAWGAMAYHQEPPGNENETDRAAGREVTADIVRNKVPYFYRKIDQLPSATLYKRPLVSIYVPAYNCAEHIVRCVDSALNQTVVDLEVCVCDDGSTDGTPEVLQRHYGGNPRVHFVSKPNGGIGSASNAALRMTRGFYIGQLDSDDYLEPDAVELCLKEFFADRKLACVYGAYRNVNQNGSLIKNGYNWSSYSREQLVFNMIVHHFRMFTARAWHLTSGFDEGITNAVDYDMYLKLSEVGPFKHVNKICYNRVIHGENTSVKNLAAQDANRFKVVNRSLLRQGIRSVTFERSRQGDFAWVAGA